jgi:hypothetical protein
MYQYYKMTLNKLPPHPFKTTSVTESREFAFSRDDAPADTLSFSFRYPHAKRGGGSFSVGGGWSQGGGASVDGRVTFTW